MQDSERNMQDSERKTLRLGPQMQDSEHKTREGIDHLGKFD